MTPSHVFVLSLYGFLTPQQLTRIASLRKLYHSLDRANQGDVMPPTIYTTIRTLSCVSLISLLAACGTPNGGYYDHNGNYIATDTPHNMQTNTHAPLPGGVNDDEDYRYTRRGYYDYNGYYIPTDSGLSVPANMFPPRGMCRVWFTDRAAVDQPPIESCVGIRARVPAGAYVIYGG